jgi:hypothetical protein
MSGNCKRGQRDPFWIVGVPRATELRNTTLDFVGLGCALGAQWGRALRDFLGWHDFKYIRPAARPTRSPARTTQTSRLRDRAPKTKSPAFVKRSGSGLL